MKCNSRDVAVITSFHNAHARNRAAVVWKHEQCLSGRGRPALMQPANYGAEECQAAVTNSVALCIHRS
jgi:hypothetical protein